MMKKIMLILLSLLAVSLFIAGCAPREKENGTLVMQITDAPSDLNIEKAVVTLSEIQVHVAGEDAMMEGNTEDAMAEEATEGAEEAMAEETSGWVTVVSEPQTFDLIELTGVTDLLGETKLEEGRYTQVRLSLDSALVTIDGEELDLTVPSSKIKLVKGFKIAGGETTTLTLDFDAQQSVIATGAGTYILKPTIKVLSEQELAEKSQAPEDAGMPEETGQPVDVGRPEGAGQQ